jgi:hypothetical protein
MFNFINEVMAKAYSMMFGSLPAKIYTELKKKLQLSPNVKVGDWFLFEKYTVIRVYGFKEEPYLFPTFLDPKIYTLDCIRQRLFSYQEYFVKFSKATTFKPFYKVGPFTIKSKSAISIVEGLLGEMNFRKGHKENYDPHHVVYEKRKHLRSAPYQHQPNPILDKIENQESREEVKPFLVIPKQTGEQEENPPSIMQTPLNKNETNKRIQPNSSEMDWESGSSSKSQKVGPNQGDYEVIVISKEKSSLVSQEQGSSSYNAISLMEQ